MAGSGKSILLRTSALLVMLALAIPAFTAEQQAPDNIAIKAPLWSNPTKSPVQFAHKQHAQNRKIACTQCHHNYKDGKNIWKEGDPVEKCAKCHTDATINESLMQPDQRKLSLMLAYHNNCRPCHQKTKRENRESKAPTVCKQCHAG